MTASIDRHVAYARSRGVPWGVSESAYNVRDRHQTYQYRAFGVPDLALKRGLGRDLVIAPYATALAAQIDPPRALANLRCARGDGRTWRVRLLRRARLHAPRTGCGASHSCSAYMAHHVGMTLVALTNVLQQDIWQARFHADSLVKVGGAAAARARAASADPAGCAGRAAGRSARRVSETERPVVREVEHAAAVAAARRAARLECRTP